jgi:hypothetical protein
MTPLNAVGPLARWLRLMPAQARENWIWQDQRAPFPRELSESLVLVVHPDSGQVLWEQAKGRQQRRSYHP